METHVGLHPLLDHLAPRHFIERHANRQQILQPPTLGRPSDEFYFDEPSRIEQMKEKMQRVRPRTLGQALGIPGVTPAAVSLINVYIEIQARRHAQAQTIST